MDLIGFVFFSLLPLSSLCTVSAIPSAAPVANDSTCPLDLTYVSRISWNSDTCRNFKPPTEPKTSQTNQTKIPCCQTLMALYRIPLSWNLKGNFKFKLPDLPTSTSCLQDFASKLASYSDSKKLFISDDAVSFCFDPLQFILSPNTCAHVNSSQDWVNQLGRTTALDSSCRQDLTNIADCERCITAMVEVQAELASRNDNTSHSRDCWFLTILYAAGIVNQLGPESDGVVSCILSADFKLDSPSKNQVDSPKSKKHTVALLGAIIPTTLLTLFAAASFYYWRRKKGDKTNNGGNEDAVFLHDTEKQIADFLRSGQFREDEKKDIDVPFVVLESIRVATDNFSEENKLGKGGFGTVYKGKFPGGQEIAIKRLSSGSGQGFQEFKNEVLLIAKLQHRNLVRLLGYCVEGEEKMLLYEYMPNKSLDSFIFDRTLCELLNWETRFNIILGIARGLLYLHHDSRLRIIHRDLKTSNVLLDKDMNPKISDFGLARIFGGKQTEGSTTRVVGTYGYMPPEYAVHGFFSIKSDVFSFGVMVLEIISGEKNTGFYQTDLALTLLGYAWKLWKQNKPLDLMNVTLSKTCNANEFLKCVNIGLLCVQENPSDRPTMSKVVFMLESETMILPSPKQPAFVAFDSISSSGSSSKQLSVNDITNTLEQGR